MLPILKSFVVWSHCNLVVTRLFCNSVLDSDATNPNPPLSPPEKRLIRLGQKVDCSQVLG